MRSSLTNSDRRRAGSSAVEVDEDRYLPRSAISNRGGPAREAIYSDRPPLLYHRPTAIDRPPETRLTEVWPHIGSEAASVGACRPLAPSTHPVAPAHPIRNLDATVIGRSTAGSARLQPPHLSYRWPSKYIEITDPIAPAAGRVIYRIPIANTVRRRTYRSSDDRWFDRWSTCAHRRPVVY